jgi:hypothetical protein
LRNEKASYLGLIYLESGIKVYRFIFWLLPMEKYKMVPSAGSSMTTKTHTIFIILSRKLLFKISINAITGNNRMMINTIASKGDNGPILNLFWLERLSEG